MILALLSWNTHNIQCRRMQWPHYFLCIHANQHQHLQQQRPLCIYAKVPKNLIMACTGVNPPLPRAWLFFGSPQHEQGKKTAAAAAHEQDWMRSTWVPASYGFD